MECPWIMNGRCSYFSFIIFAIFISLIIGIGNITVFHRHLQIGSLTSII